jgi:outer membrane protein insertion porin family
VTGGQAMWATSVEYRFPLFKRVLRGVLFWDSGALAQRITDEEFDKVRMSLGFGFRITIPFLGRRPFAIDFGFPVMKEPEDERRLISFSIGRELF